MSAHEPITDDLLMAHADGLLGAEDAARVAAWLETHPDKAAEVMLWRRQNEAIGALCEQLRQLQKSQYGMRFTVVAIEGLDTILLSLIEVAKERASEEFALLESMTSEGAKGLKSVRAAYLAEEHRLEPAQRPLLLAAAGHCERLIWLFGEIGRRYMALKAV